MHKTFAECEGPRRPKMAAASGESKHAGRGTRLKAAQNGHRAGYGEKHAVGNKYRGRYGIARGMARVSLRVQTREERRRMVLTGE